jgi:hypothetical protein
MQSAQDEILTKQRFRLYVLYWFIQLLRCRMLNALGVLYSTVYVRTWLGMADVIR